MFLNLSALNTLNTFTDPKGPKKKIICIMDDVRGDFLGSHREKITNIKSFVFYFMSEIDIIIFIITNIIKNILFGMMFYVHIINGWSLCFLSTKPVPK